jgi:hypothetical protein
MMEDGLADPVEIRHHLVVPEAKDRIAALRPSSSSMMSQASEQQKSTM